jgi:hypothetical protein
MKNITLIPIITLFATLTSLSFVRIEDTITTTAYSDTIYYNVETGIEGGVNGEFIKRYFKNGKTMADIIKVSYYERHYVGQPIYRSKIDTISSISNWVLSKQKIDTLENFKKMIINKSIIHNLPGAKIAGRHGIYSVIENGDTFLTQTTELYSLTEALRLDRK